MSISSLQNDIQRFSKDIADLQKQRSDESKKEADKSQKISQLQSSITKNTSVSSRASKERDITKLMQEIASIQSRRATIEKKLADKSSQLYKTQEQLAKEEAKERKKVEDGAKKRQKELADWQKKLSNEVAAQKSLTSSTILTEFAPAPSLVTISRPTTKYDVFVSHASEDKEEFVRPLAEQLRQLGFRVWYDEFSLKVGDNLRRSIDNGLANSRYGLVVFSGAFFAKQWPQYELDGLVMREMNGHKVILPIWHKVSKDEVLSYSPSLAGILALNSSMYSIEEIAAKLAEVLQET